MTTGSDQLRLHAALAEVARRCGTGSGEGGVDALIDAARDGVAALAERAERAAERDQRVRAALDVLGVGVVVCDEHGEEVYRNVAATGFGRGRLGDLLAERAVDELLAEARRGRCVDRALESFAPVKRELAVRAYPIAASGRPLGAVAVVEDVSERHRLDAMRRDFVANVSHELKTPVGALSLLAETLDGEDDPEVIARLAARVGAEADRLGRIIDDLLDLSRIEANERPGWEPVRVAELIGEAVDPLRPVAAARHIRLHVDDVPAGVTVAGNRRDLVSAVANLVDNAVKYSDPGSPVRVAVAATPEAVRIDVVDRGVGIPPRDRERIFERFYRVDRARSRLTGGTGLGLSIVRHVAVNHGGDITVTSEEGVGSTFTLVLPTGASFARGPGDG